MNQKIITAFKKHYKLVISIVIITLAALIFPFESKKNPSSTEKSSLQTVELMRAKSGDSLAQSEIIEASQSPCLCSKEQIKEWAENFDLSSNDRMHPKAAHTIKRHIGKSREWLAGRLEGNNKLKNASTFFSVEDAQNIITKALIQNVDVLEEWVKSDKSKTILLKGLSTEKIGIILNRKKGVITDSYRAAIVIRKINKEGQCSLMVITAYPINAPHKESSPNPQNQ